MTTESRVMPAIELARFRVADDAVDALVAGRADMIAALQAEHPALERAYLTRADDGSFVDVIVWATREAAVFAAEHAAEIPAVRDWFSHIVESGGIRHVEVLHAFAADSAAPNGS